MLHVKLLVFGGGGVTYGRAEVDVELATPVEDFVEVEKDVGTAVDEVIAVLVLDETEEGFEEIEELETAGPFWYMFRRDLPPQYSKALAAQSMLHPLTFGSAEA